MLRTNSQKGFTLLELMIAIAIMTILAAIATPSFNVWREKSNLKAEAREVFGAFQRARSEAVTRNTNIALTFVAGSGSDGTWSIFVDDGFGGGTADDYIQNGTEQSIGNGRMLNGIEISTANFNSTSATGFNSRGLPLADGSVEVKNVDKTYTVTLSPAGSVKME